MTKQTTITELKQQAEQGDADMQYILGFMYRQGECAPQDDEQAVYWWTKASEQGDAGSQYCLGNILYSDYIVDEDEIIEPDDGEAIYWWKKASQQGHASATAKLEELGIK